LEYKLVMCFRQELYLVQGHLQHYAHLQMV